MEIKIAERLRPFSHKPGTVLVIPYTYWQVQLFPTRLRFRHLVTGEEREEIVPWKGPVFDFTVELDLEKGVVWVFGHTADGYRRYSVELAGERVDLPKPIERLSLGMHKALDWELVCRRRDLREIFPLWHRLGQMVPPAGEKAGIATLLKPYDKLEVVAAYKQIFMAGFHGLMMPRLTDDDYQGIGPEGLFTGPPLSLLTEGARYIRSLFFNAWHFLPTLAPEFHAGRFVNFETTEGDRVDFEWSKKVIRRVVIRPHSSRDVIPIFQKSIGSFRVRSTMKERGSRIAVGAPLRLEAGQPLYLDRFEKD